MVLGQYHVFSNHDSLWMTTKYRAEHPSKASEDIQEGCSAGARYQVETPHVQSE